MREPSPKAPFDQGLFLAHFNKGKDLFDQRKYEAAEVELEEAYLLRPRDPKVLNLLGLVYFKQEKHEKAEEVYRKLAAESPDVPTLHYNLGLIYFKLGRLDEAESTFLKALDLSPGNAKIHFYLGSVYEKLGRPQDAIYQFRHAGANLMVRRMEDRMAAAGPPERTATTTAPVMVPSTATLPPVAPAARRSLDDTNEFRADEVQRALEAKATALRARPVGPVSDGLMAGGVAAAASRGRAGGMQFADAPAPPDTLPPTSPPTSDTLPPTGPGFRFLRGNLMEVEFSGKVFIKQGSIYSYTGNLTFWVKEKRPGGHPALVIVTGTGRLVLTDKDREITFLQVQDETVHVEPGHLLACESTLTPRYVSVGPPGKGPEFLALEGRGMVAFSVGSRPLAFSITPEMPVSIPSASVISWSGQVTAQLVDDKQVYEVLHPGATAGSLVRLDGTGRLLAEQATWKPS